VISSSRSGSQPAVSVSIATIVRPAASASQRCAAEADVAWT
jgi:hypothetical protein